MTRRIKTWDELLEDGWKLTSSGSLHSSLYGHTFGAEDKHLLGLSEEEARRVWFEGEDEMNVTDPLELDYLWTDEPEAQTKREETLKEIYESVVEEWKDVEYVGEFQSGTHDVDFKKTYPDNTCWDEIVMDFLGYLKTHYDYGIDEYDMLRMPSAVKLRRIEELLKGNPESQTYQLAHYGAVEIHTLQSEYADACRDKARKVAEALMPTLDKSNFFQETREENEEPEEEKECVHELRGYYVKPLGWDWAYFRLRLEDKGFKWGFKATDLNAAYREGLEKDPAEVVFVENGKVDGYASLAYAEDTEKSINRYRLDF